MVPVAWGQKLALLLNFPVILFEDTLPAHYFSLTTEHCWTLQARVLKCFEYFKYLLTTTESKAWSLINTNKKYFNLRFLVFSSWNNSWHVILFIPYFFKQVLLTNEVEL